MLAAQGTVTHTGRDTLPSQGHAHPHPLRRGQCRHANSPHMCSFGIREETVPGENPYSLGENVSTPHRQWPQLGPHSAFSSPLDETMLNEMTILKDPPCTASQRPRHNNAHRGTTHDSPKLDTVQMSVNVDDDMVAQSRPGVLSCGTVN